MYSNPHKDIEKSNPSKIADTYFSNYSFGVNSYKHGIQNLNEKVFLKTCLGMT